MRIKHVAIVTVLMCNLSSGLLAGIVYEDGVADAFWDDHSVVLAVIEDYRPTQGKNYLADVTLSLVATVSGKMDAALIGKVDARVSFDGLTTSNPNTLAKGDRIIVVLHLYEKRYSVRSAFYLFMPGKAGVVVVKDFTDPVIVELKERIHKIRTAPKDPNRHPGR